MVNCMREKTLEAVSPYVFRIAFTAPLFLNICLLTDIIFTDGHFQSVQPSEGCRKARLLREREAAARKSQGGRQDTVRLEKAIGSKGKQP